MTMEIIRSLSDMQAWSKMMASRGKSIALVPTMGYFHDGHLSLMRLAAEHADTVVVSLFVNPTQFGPNEDFANYPRDFDSDSDAATALGVDVLFVPDDREIYPEGFKTDVTVKGMTTKLCGRSRPGHFDGVTTVVAKLFNAVKPNCAVFGEKDYQQLAVIRKMVSALNLEISIIGHPIVREADGLAMSSRNSYLSAGERQSALCLYHSLQLAEKLVAKGMIDEEQLLAEIRMLFNSSSGVDVEYVSLVNPETLDEIKVIDRNTLLAMAVRVGRTRLIDNVLLQPEN